MYFGIPMCVMNVLCTFHIFMYGYVTVLGTRCATKHTTNAVWGYYDKMCYHTYNLWSARVNLTICVTIHTSHGVLRIVRLPVLPYIQTMEHWVYCDDVCYHIFNQWCIVIVTSFANIHTTNGDTLGVCNGLQARLANLPVWIQLL